MATGLGNQNARVGCPRKLTDKLKDIRVPQAKALEAI
jgi:hypothetical protein